VRVENGVITEIGQGLKGGRYGAGRDRLLCHARRDRSAYASGDALHGHLFGDDFESGTRAALSGGTTMVVDFVLPGQGQGLMDAPRCGTTSRAGRIAIIPIHMAVTWWGSRCLTEMADAVKAGITSFKHFMAYKGALMVNDDEMYQSFKRVAIWAGCRWSMPRTAMWWRN
jgi:dihydropyrimidinase